MTRRTITLITSGLLLVVLGCVAFLLPVPYVAVQPGPTVDTLGERRGEPVIAIDGDVRTYPEQGRLDLVTVSVTSPDGHIGLVQAFGAWFDPATALVPRDLIYPSGQTVQQANAETRQQMTGSQVSSEVAGLLAAGYPGAVLVAGIGDNSPASGRLQVGDLILAVDGERVRTPEDVVDAVSSRTPGDSVRLRVRRGDESGSQVVTVPTRAADSDAERAEIGVSVAQDVDADVSITNNVGANIGGPSAGTMFALAIYDKLTPGSLTGGRVVAGTGEISAGGVIGPIGGVQQKIVGAENDGASVFLVPDDNCAEAAGTDLEAGAITLVRVKTLDDAVSSLEALAADPQAQVPTC